MAKMTKEQAVNMLKNKKIHIWNEQESKEVQEKLFELGFEWLGTGKEVRKKNYQYMFTDSDLTITSCSTKYVFTEKNFTEITPEQISAIEIIEESNSYELNLCEILKDCPEGTEFYTDIYGPVKFDSIVSCEVLNQKNIYPVFFKRCNGHYFNTTKEGYLFPDYPNCGCIVFPSKDQRDWSKWVCPKPDLPVDTPVMINIRASEWVLRFYAGDKACWHDGLTSKNAEGASSWNCIIPFEKFNPNNIEESLKYDICKK